MAIEYMGLNNIQGPLAVIEGVDDTFYEEMDELLRFPVIKR